MFIRRNKYKFLVALLLAALAAGIGIWRAFAIKDPTFDGLRRYNVMQLISGERNFFVYFLFRCLMSLVIVTLIALSGIRFFTAWLSFALLFMYAYICAYFIGALFIFARLVVLPLALLCLIPIFIVMLFIFTFFSVHSVCAAKLRGRYCHFYDFYTEVRFPFVFAAVACLAAAVLETLLACILTIGIVL